ncbi:MAG: phosphonate metabolism protein/1,5-bisphosphokinase (PRPP-forming) PhnN [Rhodospirillales bacterium]|nr:phosphonate metabolism protein/1,5-bisphosphokinase (PRPP-forming) PhnN [Rhodospirillales bacterium]MBO6785501.1 phosphonate metabolism protein/1,5-bisphosphokinase (PRPP-forming) PhnN [Rhodospirillales bacterium]
MPAAKTHGRLFLVVGPSGAGKDTLIEAARRHFSGRCDVIFPKRTITRPADAGGEAHIPVTPEAFRTQVSEGAFALHWFAHGLGYGIASTISSDLAQGHHVVANVSRTVLDDARSRFRNVSILSVTASPEVLATRLRDRGREKGNDVKSRLARARLLQPIGEDVVEIDNSGDLVTGSAFFIAAIATLARLDRQLATG